MIHSTTCIENFPDCICNRCANEQARMKPCCGLHGVRCNGCQVCKDFKEEQEND